MAFPLLASDALSLVIWPCLEYHLANFFVIQTNFYRSVLRDQCSTSFGKANVRIRLPR